MALINTLGNSTLGSVQKALLIIHKSDASQIDSSQVAAATENALLGAAAGMAATSALELGIDVGECTEDGLFSLDACRCIGACGLAPVVTVNDDVYGKLNADMVEDILKKYEEEAGQ